MVETTIRLRPKEEWRTVPRDRWYSSWAPGFLKAVLRPIWPEETRLTWEELIGDMNAAMQFPGWTNAFTMPIKARIDMLSTGVRTPVGVKVMGTSLAEIEKIGVGLEKLLAPLAGTRSVYYERNEGGLYLDVIPRREALARYGLTVGDVNDVVEAAIGGAPIGVTVEGRNRFTISVRYPQDVRSDLERLRRLLVPIGRGGAGGGGGMGGSRTPDRLPPIRLAQMGGMGGGTQQPGGAGPTPGAAPQAPNLLSDAPSLDIGSFLPPAPSAAAPPAGVGAAAAPSGTAFVPLGQLADIRIAGGPPMVRDEGGLLVGYVFVDIDAAQRDVGGYVHEAKAVVAAAQRDGSLTMPAGYFLKWTGQYELLEKMQQRMKIVVPLTLLVIVLLLYLHFRNFTEVLIVLLSIPFALVGSFWLMWLLDYHLSTAVWVGIIALVGLAAQTGVVMIVYIDNAYERRKRAGKIRDLSDIIWAHMEGTVLRVRPKLMTVATMLAGLIPLLWATGSGADVMKRIAAPMVGGLLTSAFLTLEIIPVIYTYWRQEQVLFERLGALDPARLRRLEAFTVVQKVGFGALAALAVVPFYLEPPGWLLGLLLLAAAAVVAVGIAGYLRARSGAMRLVWPARAPGGAPA
jgi:Cu(I)/Ag(I) efflux system membrane protein CusA/SilA